jgi:monofunctional biosynthetic peptidoglycan transglycosylase
VARSSRPGLIGRLFRLLVTAVMIFGIIGPVLAVAAYRFVPPPLTYLMVQRAFEGRGFSRDWVPLEEINPRLVRAVIAAEDARFCEHKGFDVEAIQKALESNKRQPNRIRGGSTISQQTAKNVFLWPQRDWVRKGLEAYFTVLIEFGWGKRRIMEVYLNSIEWGPGIYGAEAAARKYFGVSAKNLTANQAARMAAVLPNPLEWRADRPGPYVRRRSGSITANAGIVRRAGSAACVLEAAAASAPEEKAKAAPGKRRQLVIEKEPDIIPELPPEAPALVPDPAPPAEPPPEPAVEAPPALDVPPAEPAPEPPPL